MGLKPGYKQAEIGEIPDDWEVKRIGDIATVSAGGTPSRSTPRFWNGNIPWVTTSQIDFNTIIEAEQFITKDGLKHSSAKLLPEGTLLMALYGQGKTRGKVGKLGIPAAVNQACAAIDIGRGNSRDFLLHFLASRYEAIRSLSNTGNQENLNGQIVRNIVILSPSLPEQRAIAAALSDVDALIAALDRLIAKKRDLKQAAMQRLLTGQQRLPGFGGEWDTASFGMVLSRLNAKEHQIQTSEYGTSGIYPVVDQGKEYVVGFSDREDKRFRCPRGGVIVFGDHTRVVKFVDFDFVIGADGTQILAAKAGQCARFHSYQLQHREIPNTGYNRHFKFLKELPFVVPPFPEQTAIAAVLSDMDAEIAALEARRDKTRALKQGMMQELLTGRTRLV